MKKKINNYRFQQQQQKRNEYTKMKHIKKKFDQMPVDATEELEYMKKLLNGEDVGNFGPEEPEVVEVSESLYWSTGNPWLSSSHSSVSKMSISEVLSIASIKQRKRL
jgi:hypothetical protein